MDALGKSVSLSFVSAPFVCSSAIHETDSVAASSGSVCQTFENVVSVHRAADSTPPLLAGCTWRSSSRRFAGLSRFVVSKNASSLQYVREFGAVRMSGDASNDGEHLSEGDFKPEVPLTVEQHFALESLRRAVPGFDSESLRTQTLGICRLRLEESNAWRTMLRDGWGLGKYEEEERERIEAAAAEQELMKHPEAEADNSKSFDLSFEQELHLRSVQKDLNRLDRTGLEKACVFAFMQYVESKNKMKNQLFSALHLKSDPLRGPTGSDNL